MKIIAIDSSSLVASVALLEDDNLIAEYNIQYKKTHSQTLLPMLDDIRKMVDLNVQEVGAIAISKGPGSFTGLRIGSATAKGLAQALNVPIVEIGTLEGMACNFYGNEELIIPIMDARRNQVYTGIYSFVKSADGYEMKTYLDQSAMSIDELLGEAKRLSEETGKRAIFLGDGVPVFRDTICSYGLKDYIFAKAHMNRQRAAAFGYLAIKKLIAGEGISCYEHAPEYLRLSQAERERNEGIRNKGSNY